jgi:hypothetical protein
MPTFVIGTPIETPIPSITVDTTTAAPLMPGVHRFQLQVRDNDGFISAPAAVDVVVKDLQQPTAVLVAPTEVPFGKAFTMFGDKSSDPFPGKLVAYIWTMMS